jgi:mercuric ion transport protein
MKDKAFIGASLVAGITASLCCILPIIFALAGAGIVGASAFFERWRPLLLGITFTLLGLGFYFGYRKQKHACAPGSACERPAISRAGRLWLWISTVFVLLFAAFPYYSGPVAGLLLSGRNGSGASVPQAAQLKRISISVEGMTCASCARTVESKIREIRGVTAVNVSYEKSRADIEFDPGQVTLQELDKAVQDAGYKVHPS